MINRKALVSYLILSFSLAWIFFLLPLAFGEVGSQSRQAATTILFALAMWMPGISAIVVTLFVKREKFSSLNLNRLGLFNVHLLTLSGKNQWLSANVVYAIIPLNQAG